MIASILIILVSSGLFVFWFRYTCLLLIGQGSAEYALKVASMIRLEFPRVQAILGGESPTTGLNHLHAALQHDHRILTDLLRENARVSLEHRLLALDYKVMQAWYTISRSRPHLLRAKYALAEMGAILQYFASEMGQEAVS